MRRMKPLAILTLAFSLLLPPGKAHAAFAAPPKLRPPPQKTAPVPSEMDLTLDGPTISEPSEWSKFDLQIRNRQRFDYVNGLSYIISGTIAIAGGFLGASVTNDPIEKGVYNIFQTIGIASIGYGAYTWQLGDHERLLHETIRSSEGLDDRERSSLVRSYMAISRERERKERVIRSLTHGLIAAYNLYQASQQSNPAMKNSLTFIGGVNLLATISFAF